MATTPPDSYMLETFRTEEVAGCHFDAVVPREYFRVYTEVEGMPADVRPDRELKTYRIDRILFPTQRSIDAGWDLGAVGVELKSASHDLGHALAQASDYATATWITPNQYQVRLSWVFVFPFPSTPFVGPLACLAIHNRVGYALSHKYCRLQLGCCCATPLNIGSCGKVVIHPAGSIGIRRGSR